MARPSCELINSCDCVLVSAVRPSKFKATVRGVLAPVPVRVSCTCAPVEPVSLPSLSKLIVPAPTTEPGNEAEDGSNVDASVSSPLVAKKRQDVPASSLDSSTAVIFTVSAVPSESYETKLV